MRPVILTGLRPSQVPIGWIVIKNQDQWDQFWSQHSSQPAPEIDFDQFHLVGVFLGQKPNPGYSVKIIEAREYPEKVVVQAGERTPSPGGVYIQVIVYPYDAVLIPETDKKIEVELKKEEPGSS